MRKHRTVSALALASIAVAGLAAPAAAQTKAPVVARAEQCLRRNVDRVVGAEHDLQAAAGFLVTYACAAEVSAATRYERNTAYVQMFSTLFKASAQAPGKPPPAPPLPNLNLNASVDPETGEIVAPPAAPGAPPNPMSGLLPMMSNISAQVAPDSVPVDLRKLAGDLVLAAHDQHAARAR